MKLDKAQKRDKARHNKKNGMRRDGDSVKTLQQVLIKRGEKARSKKKGGGS